MWTIYQEIERAWTTAYDGIERLPDERGVFNEFISGVEEESRTTAIVELQPWLAIFELGIEWLSYVHVALTNSLDDRKGVMGDRYLAAWSLAGSAVSFGLSTRLMCISGFDTPAKALLRTYAEALLLCLAILNDKAMAKVFVSSDDDADIKNFWHSMASPKNLHMRIMEIEKNSGLSTKDVESMMAWRRQEYEILSQSSHLSYPASVFTSRTVALGQGDDVARIAVWGQASESSKRTMFYASATTWHFSRYCYQYLIGRKPTEALLVLDKNDEWQRKIVLGRDVLAHLVSAHWNDK